MSLAEAFALLDKLAAQIGVRNGGADLSGALSATKITTAGNTGTTNSVKDFSTDTINYAALMLKASSEAEFRHWADLRTQKAAAQGIDISGPVNGGYETNSELYERWKNSTYDSGGILRGSGGIKATEHDEMVLPPETTEKLLRAEQSGDFDALLSHLNIVTAAARRENSAFSGSTTNNSIGRQYNGDIYRYILGGVTIGQQEADVMTFSQFVRAAGNLALFSGR